MHMYVFGLSRDVASKEHWHMEALRKPRQLQSRPNAEHQESIHSLRGLPTNVPFNPSVSTTLTERSFISHLLIDLDGRRPFKLWQK